MRFLDSDGEPPTTPPTRPTTVRTSASNCSKPETSYTSLLHRWWARRLPTRDLLSSLGESAEVSLLCHDLTENQTASLFRQPAPLGRGAGMSGADQILGSRSARQLRVPDRDRSGMVGAHPRCRADANVQHRGHPAGSRRPHPSHRPIGQPLLSPSSASRTAMCRMWSIPAEPSSTRAPWSFPTESATPPSAWRSYHWTISLVPSVPSPIESTCHHE